jgi:hypothetical protein
MSILGVKKKHIDTSKMEKEILKMKSEIITINRKDRYLYNNANTLNLKITDTSFCLIGKVLILTKLIPIISPGKFIEK